MSIKVLARNTLIGFVILAIVYYVCYNWIDIPLMYFVYTGAMGSMWVPISEMLTLIFSPESWTFFAAVCLVLAFVLMQRGHIKSKHFETLMRFGLTVVTTAVVVTILKITFGRYRPDMLLTQDLYGFNFFAFGNNNHSTPSGHATLGFCALLFIARHFNKTWLSFLLMLLAVAICIAKMILAEHYLSDLIFGGYLGVIMTLWMEVILSALKTKYFSAHASHLL